MIIVPPPIRIRIKDKDCEYKGEHPKVQGSRRQVTKVTVWSGVLASGLYVGC